MCTSAKWMARLAGILLIPATLFQLLALFGVQLNEALRGDWSWLLPAWVLTLVLPPLVAVLLAALGKRRGWPTVCAVGALAAAVAALAVLLALRAAFPPQVAADGVTRGLTAWRLCYRHGTSLLAAVLLGLASAAQWRENRRAYRAAMAAMQAATAGESTLGLGDYGALAGSDAAEKPHRLKRSLRPHRK